MNEFVNDDIRLIKQLERLSRKKFKLTNSSVITELSTRLIKIRRNEISPTHFELTRRAQLGGDWLDHDATSLFTSRSVRG